MTFTVAQFLHFTRCPALYELADIQRVPMPPTTRQVVSRAVRAVVLQECQARIDTGSISDAKEARQRVERAVQAEMAQDIAYTPEEAARGQRTAFERALRSAVALVNLWRAAVEPRIQPVAVSASFDATHLTGQFEIVENSNVRLTRVRSRRPAANEAQHDITVAIHAAASGKMVVVDYLIEADPLVVDRQIVEYDEAKVVALRERVNLMARCVDFPPTDPAYWRCQSCSLRACCRYV
jgi:hypothetical protein